MIPTFYFDVDDGKKLLYFLDNILTILVIDFEYGMKEE